MKYVKAVFIVSLLIAGLENIYSQSADDVIEKYIKAIGGRDRLSKISSSYVVTESRVLGMKAISRTTILYCKGVRTESEIRGRKNISVYTDKSGWSTSPKDDSQIEPIPQDQYALGREQIFICSPFLDYSTRGYIAIFEGAEKVKKGSVIKIKMVSPGNMTSEYFFDPATFYLVKAIQKTKMNDREFEIETSYSDYRDTGTGYLIPFTIESKFGGLMSFSSNVKEVKLNLPVDESIFIKP